MRRRSWLIAVTTAVSLTVLGHQLSSNQAGEGTSTARQDQSTSQTSEWLIESHPEPAQFVQTMTGLDKGSCHLFGVCAADLGIPFSMPDGEVGFLFGDTFATATPDSPGAADNWRSPVLLRSNSDTSQESPIVFSSASGLTGTGIAPEVMNNRHISSGEFTVIPNDGITLPDGRVIISYMSVNNWQGTDSSAWTTNYAELAISHDGGNQFERRLGPRWDNKPDNSDPFQMQTMQMGSDGFVYLYSVAAGRQNGPVMLQRVPWQQILEKSAYQCWNGRDFGGSCWPLFIDSTSEPSVRMLRDEQGREVWVMAYLNLERRSIVTRVAKSPQGPWSDVKDQLTDSELISLYGGFIDPRSTPDNLHLTVSSWQRDENGVTNRYDVSLYRGTV